MLNLPDECLPALKFFRTSGNYLEDVENDYRQMKPYFPEGIESVIDIGCGLAGIDILIKKDFPDVRIRLLDSGQSVPYENFQVGIGPYGDRKAAECMLNANGVSDFEWIEDTSLLRADLILSTLAWGFHFPLDTYKVDGFCIADLRKDKEKQRGKVIAESRSYLRCAFRCSK